MTLLGYSPTELLAFLSILSSSIVVIISFSLLAYTLTYNFRSGVAQFYAILLACVMITYASEVALSRVNNATSANNWLRFQWLGIALLPASYYLFSIAVLRTTNYRVRRRRIVAAILITLSLLSAIDGQWRSLHTIAQLSGGRTALLGLCTLFCAGIFAFTLQHPQSP